MAIHPLPEYRPDMADLDVPYSDRSRGVLPGPGYVRPLPALTAWSAALAGGRCLGAIAARNTSGTVEIYAGTDSKIEQLDTTDLTWDDRSVSGGYNLTADYRWSFTLFGKYLVAVSDNVTPQVLDIDSGTLFGNLTGSPPTVRFSTIIGQFLVFAGYTSTPNKMAWSGINNHTQWTVGSNQSDTQEFPSGGKIQNITGGSVSGHMFQESSIRRMTYVGGDAIFRFDEIADDIGLLAPYSVVSVYGSDYFYSNRGFKRLNADGSIDHIGANKVDADFVKVADQARINLMTANVDPVQKLIWWAYHSTSSVTDYFDSVLVYSWDINEFRPISLTTAALVSLFSPGYTLEGIADNLGYTNLDTLPASLDSSIWQGGAPVFGSFGADNKLQLFSGDNAAVEVDTGLIQPNPDGRSFVKGISPVIEINDAAVNPGMTVALGYRNLPWEALTWTSDAPVSAVTGEAYFEQSMRDGKARIKIPAGASWDKLQGIREPRIALDGYQ